MHREGNPDEHHRVPAERSVPASGAVAIRRFVNDEIASRASAFDRDDGNVFAFVCECGDLACRGTVRMTLETYASSAPGSVVGH